MPKRKSKYEEFRDTDGIIDHHTVKHKLQGKKRYTDVETKIKAEEAFRTGRPQKYLQCPICGKLTPQKVALDASGKPKREPYFGIKYVKNNGVIERRFSGIPKDMLHPVTVSYRHPKYGWHVNPKESLSPSILKRVDEDLYNEFQQILANTKKQFP